MRKRNRNFVYTMIILVILSCFIPMLIYVYIQDKHQEEMRAKIAKEQRILEAQKEKNMEIDYSPNKYPEQDQLDISYIDVEKGYANGSIVCESTSFNNASFLSGMYYKAKLRLPVELKCNKDSIYVLQFAGYSSDKSAQLVVKIGEITNKVILSKDVCYYYIPICGVDNISQISATLESDYQKIHLSDMKLIDYGNRYNISEITAGMFYYNRLITYTADADTAIVEHATSAISNEKYIYSIYNGTLNIYSLVENKSIGYLNGLGDTRDLVLTYSGKELVVTSRRNGLYIIDISNPENPSVISHYDTLEYATGISISGDYVFVCSRWFGIEIVDISDLTNPKFIAKLSGDNEYQDCFVSGEYLYVGVYNGKKVDIWDISTIDCPKKISEISLNGSGQGLFVENDYLYAATALNAEGEPQKEEYACGTGNGLEIYDISNTKRPKWISTIKTESRYNYNGQDVWDVVVSNGIAYLSNMYGGMFEIDVSDVYNPSIRSNTQIISQNSNESRIFDQNYLYPFDIVSASPGCVFHTLLADDAVYLVSPECGLIKTNYVVNTSNKMHTSFDYAIAGKKENIFPQLKGYTISNIENNANVWAIARIGDLYVVACGDDGIQILDAELNVLSVHKTEFAVHDIKVYDNYIFSAESSGGLGIYSVSNMNELEEIGRFSAQKYDDCFGSIQVTEDGHFIVIEASLQRYYILDVSDVTEPIEMKEYENINLGLMYYRSICNGLVDNKYIGIFGSSRYAFFYSEEGELKTLIDHDNNMYLRSNGAVSFEDKFISIYRNGYVIVDPKTGELPDKTKITGITFDGKPSLWGNVLIICREYSGNIMLVDINNANDPYLIGELQLEGNPDLAYVEGNRVLIPCHHQGIIVIEKS